MRSILRGAFLERPVYFFSWHQGAICPAYALERMTMAPVPCWRGQWLCPQLCDQPQNFPEHSARGMATSAIWKAMLRPR
jgi:hypothetical protein